MTNSLPYLCALGRRFARHTVLRKPTKDRVLHELKGIFVHVPKTGGNSVTSALNSIPRQSTGRLYPGLGKHAKAWEVKSAVGDDLWDSYFSFAFVRNPWDMMVSSYHWWLQKAKRWRKFADDIAAIEAMGDFDTFIQSEYGRTMINRRPGSLYDWISEDGEQIVDYLGRFETMGEDWDHICQRLGVNVPLPHLNKTERSPYRDYYTDQTRQLVAERFHRVIEALGYEF